ncbi:hypothetical protein HBB16_18970 [Pseudonocardia sp. MCCB 268]|nr:hypothetical protein [Pseudonocardia cytotoxica]
MQRALVDAAPLIGQRRFQHALNYCMPLLGPAEAHQLAIYVGWLLNGFRGWRGRRAVRAPGLVALLKAVGGLRRARGHDCGLGGVCRPRAAVWSASWFRRSPGSQRAFTHPARRSVRGRSSRWRSSASRSRSSSPGRRRDRRPAARRILALTRSRPSDTLTTGRRR